MGDAKKKQIVKREHASWQRRYRLTPARLVVVALLFQCTHWAVGCGTKPPDGSPGGDCKAGCENQCDNGSQCDNGTCVAEVPPPPCPAEASTCTLEEDASACDGGGYAFACGYCASVPYASGRHCDYTTADYGTGAATYCCHDDFPDDATSHADAGDD